MVRQTQIGERDRIDPINFLVVYPYQTGFFLLLAAASVLITVLLYRYSEVFHSMLNSFDQWFEVDDR